MPHYSKKVLKFFLKQWNKKRLESPYGSIEHIVLGNE